MKKPINIVAGENIPYVKEAFERLGNVTVLPGRAITAPNLKDTNVLLIRSITNVDEALLQGSPVKFVGTASATSSVRSMTGAWRFSPATVRVIG